MSDDLISRADAIDALQKEINKGIPPFDDTMGAIRCGVRLARNIIEDLPSAQPKRGEWIFHYRDKWMVKAECPKCHRRFEFSPRAIWKCCPMCETRMKGADDE